MSSKTKSELNSRIVGSKLWLIWLWLSAGIVCLADIAVLVVLGIEGVQGTYYVLPIVFLALDVIVTALSAVTNHRFKRALAAPIVYAVLKLAIVVLAVTMLFGDTVIFSTLAVTLWLVFEFFSIVCIILSAVFAKGSGRGFLAIVAVLTVAIIAFGAVYMVFVSTSGFFGQNKERTFEKRTLVYSYYDDNRDSLVASDVLDGNGNTIVVPAEFNGMEVKGVDCTLFAQDGVDTVVLRCSEDVEFQNTEELCYMGDDVSIYADPDCIDTYREFFYSLSIDEIEKSAGVSTYSRRSTPKSLAEAYAAFANSMYPEVEDGEDAADNVYVTVEIDYRYLPAFKNGYGEYEIPAVWIAERGSVFDPYEIYGYGYMEHTDEESEFDLCWCYYNFSNYILTDFTGPDGKSVVGNEISDSMTVSVKMVEIYAVEVGDGNDAVHTEPGLNRDFYDGYRYVTESTANEIMTEVTDRTGFTLSWEYSLSGSESRRAFTTLVGCLSDGMTIYPVWTMEAPKISASADSYTVVYGNTVSFSSDGSFSDSDVALAYVWTHGTDTESEKQSFEKENMDPTKDGGTYTVTVTAGGDGITSLTTTASASVYITVNRRNLVLEWSTTSSSVYSGYDETVSVKAPESASPATGTSGVINGDGVTFTLDRSETIKDAGVYDFEATLATCADYYVISENATWSFTIAKYTLYVVWSGETLIYNGGEQHHGYSYTDAGDVPIAILGGDTFGVEFLGEKVSGTGTNAGEYTATLSITNANYELAAGTAEDEYTIEKKEVTVVWSPAESYTYKGEAQYPEATPYGILDSEEGTVKLTYSGYGTDVGTYTVTLGISSGNYKLVAGGDDKSALSYTYTIVPKPIEITWQATLSFEYDGYAHTIKAEISDADVEAIDKGLITLSYSGDVTGIINASDDVYTVVAAVADTTASGDRARNYTISNSTKTFTITKKTGFQIEGLDLVKEHYDGTSFADNETYKYSGLAVTDDGWDVVTVTNVEYSVKSTTTTLHVAPVNVGEYTVTIYLSPGDKIGNYDYTVPESITGSITINKATLYLEWNDESLVYDGTSQHITAEITSGLVADEKVTLCYSVQTEQSGNVVDSYADAGNYYVAVSLGDAGSNYEIDSGFTVTKAYQIAPYDIKITWDEETTTLTYNGKCQIPSYSYGVSEQYRESIATILGAIVSGYLTDVGTSTAEIAISNNNYTLSNASCAFEVVAEVITVTWHNDEAYTYNGSEQAPDATIDEGQLCGEDTVEIVYTYNDSSDRPVDAGIYTIKITLNCGAYDNYVISAECDTEIEFEIAKKALNLTWSTDSYETDGNDGYYKYTYEKNITHMPTYSDVGGIVDDKVAASIIEVTYYKIVDGKRGDTSVTPMDAGTYVVVAKSIDSNYYLYEEKEIVINPKPVEVTVTWDGCALFTYDGTQVGYVPDVTLSETGLDFNVSYVYTSEGTTLDGAPRDVGTYTLTVTASISDGNYVLNEPTVYVKSYEITARELSVQEDTATQSFVYSGNPKKPSYEVLNLVTGESGSIIETYYASGNLIDPLGDAPVNVGTYVLVLTSGDHNYSMNVSISFEITKKEVSATVSWSGDSPYTYDGSAKEHLATITIEDSPEYEAEYSYSYTRGDTLESAPTNVGCYIVTVTLTMTDGNYAFTGDTVFSVSYVIQAKELSVEVLREQQSLTYDGSGQTPEYTVKGLEGDDDGSIIEMYYSISNDIYASLSGAPTNVGSYVLILTSGDTNYSLYAVIEYEIVPMPVTPVVTWNETSYTYDGNAKEHLPKITIGNLICGTDYTVEYSYSDYPSGTSLGGAPTDAGEYTVTVTITLLNANYKLTASEFKDDYQMASEFKDDYQITKREITVEATENQSFVYDGSAKSPSYTAGNIVECESEATQVKETYYALNDVSTPLTGAPSDAGSYVLLLTTENSNYSLDVSINFEITPAILTATVEWNTEDYTYDGGEKKPTATIVLSDMSIGFTPTYTYRDENGTECTPRDAGTYTVELTIELTSSNYALETATFTHEFTIKTAELTINWTNEGNYSSSDGTNHPTAEVVCPVNDETVTVAYTYYRVDEGGSVLYGDGTKAPTEAGNYKVVITLEYSGSGDNYTVTGSWEQSYTIVADNYNGEDNGN